MRLFREGIGIDQEDFDFQEYLQTLGFERPAPQAVANPSSQPFNWEELEKLASSCQKCSLGQSRKRVVWGQGSRRPRVVFVGDFPGPDDESTGRAFGGPAGDLLTRMIQAMGLNSEDTFVMLAVQCRAPEDRTPTELERSTCGENFLREKLKILAPEFVIALGSGAALSLLGDSSPPRGQLATPSWGPTLQVMPTFHPAYLLKNPEAKKAAWSDLQIVMKQLSSSLGLT